MFFTKIRLVGLYNIDLPILSAQPSDRYLLKSADGLGPPESDVSIASTLYQGGVYRGRQTLSREIVLRVGLNANWYTGQTPSFLRNELYGLLTPGSAASDSILVALMNGPNTVVQAVGFVKRIEIVPFAKEPEVQITISCLNPYLEAPSSVDLTGLNKSNPQIQNAGNAPSGFLMELTLTANKSQFILSDRPVYTDGNYMQFTYAFLSGDLIKIDTRYGTRDATVTRAGVEKTLLNALVTASDWLILHGGLNNFYTSTPDFNWGTVRYRPKYWGV
jgi:hypothetical protein